MDEFRQSENPIQECRPQSDTLARRSLLGSIAAILVVPGTSLLAQDASTARVQGKEKDADSPTAEDTAEIARVQDKARMARLGTFRMASTGHFLGMGDAPASFQNSALEICENLAQVFVGHFNERSLTVALPPRRMTVITLRDERSYAAYLGDEHRETGDGHYDVDTGQLVIFDHQVDRVNLFTLIHEAAHQLCFGTGLLSKDAELPTCISEGLATYVELWRPKSRTTLGSVNGVRLQDIRRAAEGRTSWIDIDDLIGQDRWFEEKETELLAYGEAWLLAWHFLKLKSRAPRFGEYLKAVRGARKPDERLEIATRAFGPLRNLDRELRREKNHIPTR